MKSQRITAYAAKIFKTVICNLLSLAVCKLGRTVNEQLSVKVVKLVAYRTCEQLTSVDLDGLSVAVHSTYRNIHRAFNLSLTVGNRMRKLSFHRAGCYYHTQGKRK